jgi:predicted DCC family thiol-disulfide oxidoreductase YuxK
VSRPALVYQGTCRFCCAVTSLVLVWDRDRRLRPVALETAEATDLLREVPIDLHARSWHLVDTDGAVFSAGNAFPELFALLPGGRGLAALSGVRPGLTQQAYAAVASRRGAIGRALPDRAVGWARGVIDGRSS